MIHEEQKATPWKLHRKLWSQISCHVAVSAYQTVVEVGATLRRRNLYYHFQVPTHVSIWKSDGERGSAGV